MSKHVLVTGFEPFGDVHENPSAVIAQRLDGRSIAGCNVITEILPVQTGSPKTRLAQALTAHSPVAIVGLGVAAGRNALALERFARNRLHFDFPDNAGVVVRDRPVSDGGPAERETSFPVDAILNAWAAQGVPGYVSDDAGAYLCNEWLYQALEIASPGTPTGFIHLPALPAYAMQRGPATTPSMSAELMEKGIVVLIEILASLDSLNSHGANASPERTASMAR